MYRVGLGLVVGLLLASVAWSETTHRTSIVHHFRNGTILPNDDIQALEQGSHTIVVSYGGELAENGTIFFGPVPLLTPQPAIDAATFDAQTNATEATADAPVLATATIRPMAMRCITNATLGASESIIVTLRTATETVLTADGTGFACSIGTGATSCEEHDNGATMIAANAATALRGIMASDNGDGDDLSCLVWYAVD